MENIDLFDRYIKNQLSDQELKDFESRLKSDPGFASDFKIFSLSVVGIIREAEQENKDFEIAMKNISKEDLRNIIGYKTHIPLEDISVSEPIALHSDINLNSTVVNQSISMRHPVSPAYAMETEEKAMSTTKNIDTSKFKMPRWIWQAACYALIIGGATIWIAKAERDGREAINKAVFEMEYVYDGVAKGSEDLPDLNGLSDEEVRDKIPSIEQLYSQSQTVEQQYENGSILALAYIRINERDKAKKILTNLIERLSEDEDFTKEQNKLERILKVIQ